MTDYISDDIRAWSFLIKDSNGYPLKVVMNAKDFYTARELSRAMYGDRVISDPALH